MPITERTLRKWRKEALEDLEIVEGWDNETEHTRSRRNKDNCILRMTQELLDQHLLRKK